MNFARLRTIFEGRKASKMALSGSFPLPLSDLAREAAG
jgi:hypothetical protein